MLGAIEFDFPIGRPNNGFVANCIRLAAVRTHSTADGARLVRTPVDVNHVGHEANCTADSGSDVKSSAMRTQTRTKTKVTPQELVDLKNLLPALTRLVETGKISIRLGPVVDVKYWLNNYQAFEKTPNVTIIGIRSDLSASVSTPSALPS